MDQQVTFHQRFRDQIAAIQQQIGHIGDEVPDRRKEAHDRALAAISALSTQVSDAADYVSSYDQRSYLETIKTAQDELKNTMAKVAPRTRFQFKNRPGNAPHAATSASRTSDPRLAAVRTNASNTVCPVADLSTPLPPRAPARDYNALIAASTDPVRRPSFSAASTIALASHADVHIALPASASAATSSTGSLTGLRRCVIDLSAVAFPMLMLRDITDCILIANRVDGPIHMTAVARSTLVLGARQVRMHECDGVDVYLRCGSRPIIEACSGMRFAPIPTCFEDGHDPTKNQWDQIDDFKWLKTEHSPNWTILPEEQRMRDASWGDGLTGERQVEATLRILGR